MKVVILCGGKGTRLKEETEFKPKPMVLIGGKPILWHIMKIYSAQGFNDFILCLGYKGDIIKNYFLNYQHFIDDFTLHLDLATGQKEVHQGNVSTESFRITFVNTGEDTQTGERLKMVGRYIGGEDFMVTYGDGVADVNLSRLVEFHRSMGAMGTITCTHPHSKYGLVTVNDNALIGAFEQKPRLFDYINGGFMVFKKEFLDVLQPGHALEDVFPSLIQNGQMAGYRHEGFWHCMDTHKDMEDLNKIWSETPYWKLWT